MDFIRRHRGAVASDWFNLTQKVDDLLQVTQLLTVYDVYDKEEDVSRAFGKKFATGGQLTMPTLTEHTWRDQTTLQEQYFNDPHDQLLGRKHRKTQGQQW